MSGKIQTQSDNITFFFTHRRNEEDNWILKFNIDKQSCIYKKITIIFEVFFNYENIFRKKIMEDYKKENANKMKRSKNEQVTLAVLTYLQKRNYPASIPLEVTAEELDLDVLVESEMSRPNSIMYSCYTSDPAIIDHSFLKFVTWVKELNKIKNHEDLYYVIGPLFCHLYLEIVQRGHNERAANFLKQHLPSIDGSKCDEDTLKLINLFTSDVPDLCGLKQNFRENKYVINLQVKSTNLLKKYLAESCHTVMLQVFQTWFQIIELNHNEVTNNTEEVESKFSNGYYVSETSNSTLQQKVQEAISLIKQDMIPLYRVSLSNLKDDVTCGLINRDAGFILYSYNSSIFLNSLKTLRQLDGTDKQSDIVIREHRSRVYDIAYIASVNHFISASHDKTLRLFDLNNYIQKLVYKGHDHPVYCVTATKNGHYIVSGSYDHTARLWSTENSNTLRVYIGHTQEVTSVDFHPNALYFCTGAADKNIRMWSLSDSNPIRLFLGSKGIVYSVSFSCSGRYMASAGDDKRLRIWDLVAGKQLLEIKVGPEPTVKIQWSSDDSILCTGTIDGTIRYWDINNIIKNPSDTNQYNTKYSVSLNAKLLSLEYSHNTFASLTAKTSNSSYLNT